MFFFHQVTGNMLHGTKTLFTLAMGTYATETTFQEMNHQ